MSIQIILAAVSAIAAVAAVAPSAVVKSVRRKNVARAAQYRLARAARKARQRQAAKRTATVQRLQAVRQAARCARLQRQVRQLRAQRQALELAAVRTAAVAFTQTFTRLGEVAQAAQQLVSYVPLPRRSGAPAPKSTVCPSVAARRAAAEGAEWFLAEVKASANKALNHGWVDNSKWARAQELAAARMQATKKEWAAAEGMTMMLPLPSSSDDAKPTAPTSTPISNMQIVEIQNEVSALSTLKIAALKERCNELGLSVEGDRRKVETYRTALSAYYEEQLSALVEETPAPTQISPASLAAGAQVEEGEEPKTVKAQVFMTALPVVQPIAEAHIQTAWEGAYSQGLLSAVKGNRFQKELTNPIFPMSVAVLDAYAIIRYRNPIHFPAGFKDASKNLVVPVCFLEESYAAGKKANGKTEWKEKATNVFPHLELLLTFCSMPEQETVKGSWLGKLKKDATGNSKADELRGQVFAGLKKVGFTKRQAQAYFEPITQVVSALQATATSSAMVMVPAELEQPIRALAATKTFSGMQRLLGKLWFVGTNWCMPSYGNDYRKALAVFKVLEQWQQKLGFSAAIEERPLTLIETTGQFEVWFGGHLSFTFKTTGEVMFRDHANGSQYVVQGVLACAKRYYGKFRKEDIRPLNAIDQVLHHLEYHLFDVNRRYETTQERKIFTSKVLPTVQKYHASTMNYVKKAYIMEFLNNTWQPTHAMQRLRETCSLVSVCQVGLLVKNDRDGRRIAGRTIKRDELGTQSNKDVARTVALKGDFAFDAFAKEQIDSLAAIDAAFEWGYTLHPYGNASSFAPTRRYADAVARLPQEQRKPFSLAMVGGYWVEKKMGKFSEEAVAAYVAKLLGGQLPDEIKVGSDEFWALAADALLMTRSDKASKAIKRVTAMSEPIDMMLVGMTTSRFRPVGEAAVKQVRRITTGLMLQHPVEPGVGYIQPGLLEAQYETSGRSNGVMGVDVKNPFTLEPQFAELAEEVLTTVGVKALKFKQPVAVEFGQLVGHVNLSNGERQPINAEQASTLSEIRFGFKTELTGSFFKYSLKYRNRTFTHKLRLNIKLNAVNADTVKMLGMNKSEMAADLLVMQDCNKWFDLRYGGIYSIIAETMFGNTKYADVCLRANQLFAPGEDVTEHFLYSRLIQEQGGYDELLEVFKRDFLRSAWWHTPAADDFCQLYQEMYAGVAEAKFQGWRVGYAEELTDAKVPADAWVFTNAPEGSDINSIEHAAIVGWTDVDGIKWVAIRGAALIGTHENPLVAPVLSEYTAIEQAIGDTATLAFDLVDLGLKGMDDLALHLIHRGDSERLLHTVTHRMLEGLPFSVQGAPVANLPMSADADFFSAEEKEVLAEVDSNPVAWIEKVSQLKKDIVLEWAEFSLYLPALGLFGFKRVLAGEENVVSKTYTILRLLSQGFRGYSDEVMGQVRQLRAMMETFIKGITHTKELVRGASAVTCKVAGIPILATGTAAVLPGGNVEKEMRAQMPNRPSHIMMWRPPIRNGAVLQMVWLGEDAQFDKLYSLGYYQLSGDRLYCGRDQNFNFGDNDGDPVKFINVSGYVKKGLLEVDSYDSMMSFLEDAVGIDMRTAGFWRGERVVAGKVEEVEVVQQYFADHFFIPSFGAISAKIDGSLKMLQTQKSFVGFLNGAGAVQKIAVGQTYRLSGMHEMFAEIFSKLPAAMIPNQGWAHSFSYLRDEDARKKCTILETLYEVALGGYAAEMVPLFLGYLCRAVGAETEVEETTLSEIRDQLTSRSDSGLIDCALADVVEFTHVNRAVAEKALSDLGYSPVHLEYMTKAALLAGFGKNLHTEKDGSRVGEIGMGAAPMFTLIVGICQTIFDFSQGKRAVYVGSNEMRDIPDTEKSMDLVREIITIHPELRPVAEWICENTATGALYGKIRYMYTGMQAGVLDLSAKHLRLEEAAQ